MTRRIYKPMLAKVAAEAFNSKDWVFEVKWDGFRAIAYVDKDAFSLKSRNGNELKQNFPELEELTHLASGLVVDGEIVVMQGGKPDFQSLLQRGQAVSPLEIQRQTQRSPAIYIVFDILEKNGASLLELPLVERKKILRESLKEGSNVVLCDYVEEQGEAYFESALKRGLEGVVAKKKTSIYEEGLRTGSWLKIKRLKTCDCVIFGYTRGEKSRANTFGALLLGLYNAEGKAVYVGKVGTGFTQQALGELTIKLEKLRAESAPFAPEAGDAVVWVTPKMVCEVGFQVVTRDLRLRMARFHNLREDKSPLDCTLDQIVEEKNMGKNSEKLSEYASKRNFQKTPEPAGGEKAGEPLIFVVQEHNARRLHFDLRLERDGVLKSWAVPKGIPEDSGVRHLAVETEDHPLGYAGFEGTIPKGEYGAGTVKIFDKGNFDVKLWEKDKIEFTLHGNRLKSRYVLVRLKRAGEKDWLLLKGKQ
jgi:bifunctional non-homologous end joining protein LigD